MPYLEFPIRKATNFPLLRQSVVLSAFGRNSRVVRTRCAFGTLLALVQVVARRRRAVVVRVSNAGSTSEWVAGLLRVVARRLAVAAATVLRHESRRIIRAAVGGAVGLDDVALGPLLAAVVARASGRGRRRGRWRRRRRAVFRLAELALAQRRDLENAQAGIGVCLHATVAVARWREITHPPTPRIRVVGVDRADRRRRALIDDVLRGPSNNQSRLGHALAPTRTQQHPPTPIDRMHSELASATPFVLQSEEQQ